MKLEIRFGYSVNGYGVGDLVAYVNKVSDKAINELISEYEKKYDIAEPLKKGNKKHQSLKDAAKIELGIKTFLEEGGFKGFTTTFEDLHGLNPASGFISSKINGTRLRFWS